ncbi:hypothetical protein GmHk_20G057209 [Glycine max]|nr:hypothetical protein GmHk_20G057209 [Glycine max]
MLTILYKKMMKEMPIQALYFPSRNQPPMTSATPRPANSTTLGASYNNARHPPKDEFSPIPMAYSELWPSLLENHLVVAIPWKVIQPPYPKWYNSNATCAYHSGAPEHNIYSCLPFKYKGPNIKTNPLASHGGASINAIKKDKPSESKRLEDVATSRRFIYQSLQAACMVSHGGGESDEFLFHLGESHDMETFPAVEELLQRLMDWGQLEVSKVDREEPQICMQSEERKVSLTPKALPPAVPKPTPFSYQSNKVVPCKYTPHTFGERIATEVDSLSDVKGLDTTSIKELGRLMEPLQMQAFCKTYGKILELTIAEVSIEAIASLTQYYDQPLRCFTFGDFQLVPTIEEFEEILGCPLGGRKPYLSSGCLPSLSRIATVVKDSARGLDRIKKTRNGIAGLPRKYLEDKARGMANQGDWVPFMDVLALLIFGVVLFPNVDGLVDLAAIDAFLAYHHSKESPVVAVLADLFDTFNRRCEKSSARTICCLPTLCVWLVSHLFQQDTRHPCPLQSHRSWYPMRGAPTEESMSPFLVRDFGAQNVKAIQRIHKAWETPLRKDQELRGIRNGIIGGYHEWLKVHIRGLDWLAKLKVVSEESFEAPEEDEERLCETETNMLAIIAKYQEELGLATAHEHRVADEYAQVYAEKEARGRVIDSLHQEATMWMDRFALTLNGSQELPRLTMGDQEETQEQMKVDMSALKEQMASMMEAMLGMRQLMEKNVATAAAVSSAAEADPTLLATAHHPPSKIVERGRNTLGHDGNPHLGYNRAAYPYGLPPNYSPPVLQDDAGHIASPILEREPPQQPDEVHKDPQDYARRDVEFYPPIPEGPAPSTLPQPNITTQPITTGAKRKEGDAHAVSSTPSWVKPPQTPHGTHQYAQHHPSFSAHTGNASSSAPVQPKAPTQREAPQVPTPNTTRPAGNSNSTRNFPPRPFQEFTPLPMTYEDLLPSLIANHLAVVTPRKVLQPPFPKWYDPNATCKYHGDVPGHSIEKCLALKYKVQHLIDAGWLTFQEDRPNVRTNPLANHGRGAVNAVESDRPRRSKPLKDVATPRRFIFEALQKGGVIPHSGRKEDSYLLHSGELHDMETCLGVEELLQRMTDQGRLEVGSEGREEQHICMQSTDGSSVVKPKPLVIYFTKGTASQKPGHPLAAKPVPFPYRNSHTVPWRYTPPREKEEEATDVSSLSAKVTNITGLSGVTRSGRVFVPPNLPVQPANVKGKGKVVEEQDGEAPHASNKDIPAIGLSEKKDGKKEVSLEEASEFLRIIQQSEFKVIEQLNKTPARVSLLELLMSSEPHRALLIKVLNEAHQ